MKNETFEFDINDPILRFHIEYDYLTVDQYANLLKAISGINEEVFYILTNNEELWEEAQVLVLDRIKTGNSISFKIGNLGDINFEKLPRWVKHLLVTGILIIGVQQIHGNYLENEKTKVEIENKKLENEKIRRELENEDLDKLSDLSNSHVQRLQMHLHAFASEVSSDNIAYIGLNGVTIKRKEGTDPRPEEEDETFFA